MYVVTSEPKQQMLMIRVEGFWTKADLEGYLAELRQQSAALSAAGGLQRVLVDMSTYPVQAQEVANAHASALMHARDKLGARVAVVMTSALSRLQASRVAQVTGNQVFATEAEACAWLMGPSD